jgi:hypothetical protein
MGSRVGVMVFNATFNNISAIWWWSVFCWWRTPEYLDKTTNLPQVADKRYHTMLYRVHPACVGFGVIGTDFIGS